MFVQPLVAVCVVCGFMFVCWRICVWVPAVFLLLICAVCFACVMCSLLAVAGRFAAERWSETRGSLNTVGVTNSKYEEFP